MFFNYFTLCKLQNTCVTRIECLREGLWVLKCQTLKPKNLETLKRSKSYKTYNLFLKNLGFFPTLALNILGTPVQRLNVARSSVKLPNGIFHPVFAWMCFALLWRTVHRGTWWLSVRPLIRDIFSGEGWPQNWELSKSLCGYAFLCVCSFFIDCCDVHFVVGSC